MYGRESRTVLFSARKAHIQNRVEEGCIHDPRADLTRSQQVAFDAWQQDQLDRFQERIDASMERKSAHLEALLDDKIVHNNQADRIETFKQSGWWWTLWTHWMRIREVNCHQYWRNRQNVHSNAPKKPQKENEKIPENSRWQASWLWMTIPRFLLQTYRQCGLSVHTVSNGQSCLIFGTKIVVNAVVLDVMIPGMMVSKRYVSWTDVKYPCDHVDARGDQMDRIVGLSWCRWQFGKTFIKRIWHGWMHF